VSNTFSTQVISTTAVPLQLPNTNPTSALLTVDGDALRVRLDGSNPTASIGHLVTYIEIDSYEELKNFRAIRSGGSDSTLSITYRN